MNGTRGLVIAVVAALVVGFSLGMVSGILFMRFLGPGRSHVEAFMRSGPGGPGLGMHGPMGPGRLLAHLEAALDLTPQQHEAVRAALEKARDQTEAVHESTHVAIERVLTEKQRAQWRAMEERYGHGPDDGHARGHAGEDRP
jgi:hypothetical protein